MLVSGILIGVTTMVSEGATATGWDTETVDDGYVVGYHTSIDVDSQGDPHISYGVWNSSHGASQMYARWEQNDWTTEKAAYSGIYFESFSSIAIDSSDRPHISYAKLLASPNNYINYLKWNGSGWEDEGIAWTGDMPSETDIALDAMDHPHIIYFYYVSFFNSFELYYAWWNGSSWDFVGLDQLGDWAATPSIAVDSLGYAHISYYKFLDRTLNYMRRTASGWEHEVVLWDVDPLDSSIALDSNDQPYIAYAGEHLFDWNTVGYAVDYGELWGGHIIDNVNSIPPRPSLAFDSKDRPHISYSGGSGILKYARWFENDWQVEIVDSENNVGRYSSLAIDDNDGPHISYFDRAHRDLKYAKRSSSELFRRASIPLDLHVVEGDFQGNLTPSKVPSTGATRFTNFTAHRAFLSDGDSTF